MTRRKQNCPKKMKWDGPEGEEPPEGFQEEDGDGDDDDDDESRQSSDSASIPETPKPPNDSDAGTNSPRKDSVSSPVPPSSSQPARLRGSSSGNSTDYEDNCSVGTTFRLPPTLTLPPTVSPSRRYFSTSPPLLPMSPSRSASASRSPSPAEDNVLDFSTKKQREPPTNAAKEGAANGPLDLSVGNNKKRQSDENAPPPPPPRKVARVAATPMSPWSSPLLPYQLPYFAAAASMHKMSYGDASTWNGKVGKDKGVALGPSEATKALEKMSELSKLGNEDYRPASGSGRHSAWQSHWLNKGAEQAKDVLKCVWCKQSFPSLAAMTTHMQEAKHCGVNVPGQGVSLPTQPPSSAASSTQNSPSAVASSKSSSSDLNLLIKETMPLPRKLVRGQDVWLGKGAEQTRQILKCMWCGQSFRSLAEMTSHMQQTQHYTNIISQEQIISWKSSEEGKASSGSGSGSAAAASSSNSGSNSHVSAVLTCKVCDQAFTSLKELSNHMVKNSHYKEHIMRSITESGGRRRQTREKRKKSLPVRKLLELERAQNELKNGGDNMMMMMMMGKGGSGVHANRITCEKCGDKIEMSAFMDHIRLCMGVAQDKKNLLKNALMSYDYSAAAASDRRDHKGRERHHRQSTSPAQASDLSLKDGKEGGKSSAPSVLNAIEKLIEKSFDPRSRQGNFPTPGNGNSPIGSSILKRLGIDESVDYTKPLMDSTLLGGKYAFAPHGNSHDFFTGRQRSGSESSSVSERGSVRRDSTTPPDRKEDKKISSNRTTPEKSPAKVSECKNDKEEIRRPVSRESSTSMPPPDEDLGEDLSCRKSSRRSSSTSPAAAAVVASPHSASPCSERSPTPRSVGENKKSSLGALSSMFDNLSGGGDNPQGKTSSHPLAALQKLCDKTETHHQGRQTSTTPGSHSPHSQPSPGAILAFSWACNDAVVTDSIMKCAFCDTPFISKGAYRHHLSKMHFVKDGVIPDPVPTKSSTPSPSGKSNNASNNNNTSNNNNNNNNNNVEAPKQAAKSPPRNLLEESTHSKFLKYTELAKQLSSKYV